MQLILWITVVIIILLICLGIALFILLPKKSVKNIEEIIEHPTGEESSWYVEHDRIYDLKSTDVITVLDVTFQGYTKHFTYAVNQKNIKKNQYVLVLTQDGIRCAKVVTNPREIKVSDLAFPPFLLQSIICVADETDVEYYS